MRRIYETSGVDVDDLGPDPVVAFGRWFADAAAAGVAEPNAMVLATVGADGTPAARTVLLKGYDGRGLRFFTNLGSAKALDLAANPRAALVFPWHQVARQVRVTGPVVGLGRDEVEAYFATRPRESQVGAWASPQSQVVASRAELDEALAAIEGRFPAEVPAPPGWGGFRVVPEVWEFWAGRTGRLHDRLRYRRTAGSAEQAAWTIERLAP
jgi:pyridoxamine 5'-phosphate oxidase